MSNPIPDSKPNGSKKIGRETYLLALVTSLLVAFELRIIFHSPSYAAGLQNHEQWTPVMKEGIYGIIAIFFWCVIAIFAIIWLAIKRKKRHLISTFVFMSILIFPLLLGIWSFSRQYQPRDAYLSGLALWTSAQVDAPDIRKWLASRTAIATTQPIASTLWPTQITAVAPDDVDVMPDKSGVFLTWGTTAEFSSRRQVFVGANDTTPAPKIVKWGGNWLETSSDDWKLAGSGVWISEQ